MSRLHLHPENHLVARIGWLRAAVLGANDGIVSTASLIVGVVAAAATQNDVLIAGIAGLAAGAMSMAAGEYVSVSSQSDTEQADLARERKELKDSPEFELDELTDIYVKRGAAAGWLEEQIAIRRVRAREVRRDFPSEDRLAPWSNHQTTVPNNFPIPAVRAIANAPQKVTRAVARRMFAPPAFAPIAPKRERNPKDAAETIGTSALAGDTTTMSNGMAAPTENITADVSAACTGRAVVISEIPSSSRAWAVKASFAISC